MTYPQRDYTNARRALWHAVDQHAPFRDSSGKSVFRGRWTLDKRGTQLPTPFPAPARLPGIIILPASVDVQWGPHVALEHSALFTIRMWLPGLDMELPEIFTMEMLQAVQTAAGADGRPVMEAETGDCPQFGPVEFVLLNDPRMVQVDVNVAVAVKFDPTQ